jgi:hypothetical protein
MKTPEQILNNYGIDKNTEEINYHIIIEAMVLYASQFRTERLTNEQIDAMFPITINECYLARRIAARQIRDLLQGEE